MPRVRFTAAFDWKPKPQVTIAYPEGFEGMVTTPCAEKAIAAKKAVRVSDGVSRKINRVGEAPKEAQPDATNSERPDQASAWGFGG